MNAWTFMIGMTLLSAFLQFCSVRAEASYAGDEFFLQIRYLFVRYRVCPRPERKAKKQKPGKAAKKKPFRVRDLLRKNGLSGFLELVGEAARVALGSAKKLFSHLVVDRLSVELSVGGEDAAQVALRYAETCGAVSTAFGALLSAVKCRRPHVRVTPDFQGGESAVRFRVRARVRLFFLIMAGLSALIGFGRLYLKSKKQSDPTDRQKKAVLYNGGPSD